jgi:hypothetical protein
MLDTGIQILPVGARQPIGFRYHGEDLNGLPITAVTKAALPTDLVVEDPVINADADGFYSWMSGGVAGTDYFVLFVWTRSDGAVTPDLMRVCVR